MALFDLVTLPFRLTSAAVETTLALGRLVDEEGPIRRRDGYADRAMLIIGPGGLVDRLTRVLTDPRRPMSVVNTVTALLDQDRPVGRALARDGALDQVTRPGGVLDRLLAEDGLLERLLAEDGFVERLAAEGGTLDQLVALGATLERIQPRLAELIVLIPELHESVNTLNTSVGPLGELANRLPGGRRRNALEA